MDITSQSHSVSIESAPASILSDEDAISSLTKGYEVQKDVQEALASLVSALSAASNPGVIPTVRHRFHERAEACAGIVKATEKAREEREKKAQSDEAYSKREASLCEEIRRLEKSLNAAEEIRQRTQLETEASASVAQKEIDRQRERAGAAEKDIEEWRRKFEAGESRLESMKAEVGVLHEAMVGLHGEMGAVQRELDSAKASQDKLTKERPANLRETNCRLRDLNRRYYPEDLAQAEGQIRKKQEALSAMLRRAKDAEKRLRKESIEKDCLSEELRKVSRQTETEISALTAEVNRLKKDADANRPSSDKLNATNRDLNILLQNLSTDLEQQREAAEANAKRAIVAEEMLRQKGEGALRLGEALAATKSKLADADRETSLVKDALSKASAEGRANLAEVERQKGEMKLLEREKRDLILDVQERVRAFKETMCELERCKELIAEAERVSEQNISAKLAADDRNNKAQDELKEAKRATAEREERIEALRLELSTLQRTVEQTSETTKSKDRESAQRIVQLSRGNAKLSSEAANVRARLTEVEDSAERTVHKLEDTTMALAKSQEGVQRMDESIQRLEEELEVANARWKAAQGQLEAAERREKRVAEEARRQLKEALESKNKEVEALLKEAEENNHHRSLEAEASRCSAARSHERALVAVREEAEKKVAREEARRVREVSEARRKSRAVFGALQALQGELQNSEAKGVGLERQVSQLSARVNRSESSSVASSGAGNNSGRSWGGESEAGNAGGGGSEGGRNSKVIEAGMASLRRQLNSANQAKETAEKGATEARSRSEEEMAKTIALEQCLCDKEGEMLTALERLEALKQRLQEAEERNRDTEEDLRGLVCQRESEIGQLERRNRVLSDALSRLTSSEADPDSAANLSATSTISDDGAHLSSKGIRPSTLFVSNGCGADSERVGFPALPRLSRGRGITESLEESWQSASASLLSPTTGEGSTTPALGPEASLSALGDGSAGFTPPAPSEGSHLLVHRESKRMQLKSNQCGSDSSSGRSFVVKNDVGALGGSAVEHYGFVDEGARKEWEEQASSTSVNGVCRVVSGSVTDEPVSTLGGGRWQQSKGQMTTAAAGQDNRGKGTNTMAIGDNGILRGLSAAMAAGALPTLETLSYSSSYTTPAKAKCVRSHRGGVSDHAENAPQPQPEKVGGTDQKGVVEKRPLFGNRQNTHERGKPSHSSAADLGDDPEMVKRSAVRQADDRGDLARRQVDQALRDRALRRRRSESDVMAAPLRLDSSSLSKPRKDMGAESIFQNSLYPEFSRDSTMLRGGGGETRFINLDGPAHRARGGGPKKGLPGRGGNKTRVRSATTVVANGSTTTTAKKTQPARVYRMPQKGR